jgi:acylphosphatase
VNTRRTIRVSGHVQGVYFRASARAEARRLGLMGFARNEPDGSVLIEVEGEEEALAHFVAWCRVGPARARVERVDVTEDEPRGYVDFGVG